MAHPAATNRLSFWLAGIGFFLLAIGELLFSWFPAQGSLEFALQTVGPVLIAIGLLLEWRAHVECRGWGAFIFFFIAILAYAALWLPYALHPESLGTDSASQLGYDTIGVGYICAAIGTFLVMRRKEAQLEHPMQTDEPAIRATFTELLFFGVGALLSGVDCIWVGKEDANLAQFSLLAIGLVLIAIAIISFETHLSSRIGRPAAIAAIAAVVVYALHSCLQSLPAWMDPDWRVSLRITGLAFALGGLSCVLAAVHHQKASASR